MRRLLPFLLLSLLLAAPARAQPDADSLRAILQSFLSTWTNGLLGPSLTVAPDGDGFAIALPVGEPGGQAALAARIHPLDATRWAIDSASLPSRLDLGGAGGGTLSLGRQTISGVFDPTLASESRIDATFEDYTLAARGARKQVSHAARVTGHTLWTPVSPGHVTMTTEAEATGYASRQQMPEGPPFDLTAQRVRLRSLADDVDFAAVGAMLRAALTLADHAGAGAPPDRATMRTLLHALADTAGTIDSEQQWQGIAFRAGEQAGTLARAAVGFNLRAPDGLVRLRLPLALDGFASPTVTDPALRDVLPRSLRLTPELSGISREAVLAAIDRLADQTGRADPGAEIDPLLASGQAALAVHDLAIQAGPLTLTGHGTLHVPSMDAITGEAELRATGLDALIRQANAAPVLKPGVPVLLLLKGIAEQRNGTSIWRITYAQGQLLVNGTNLSDLGLAPR